MIDQRVPGRLSQDPRRGRRFVSGVAERESSSEFWDCPTLTCDDVDDNRQHVSQAGEESDFNKEDDRRFLYFYDSNYNFSMRNQNLQSVIQFKTKNTTLNNWQGKVSDVISLYSKMIINLWSILLTSRKEQDVKFNTRCPSFTLRIFIVFACLVLTLQLLPSADAAENLGNPYKILGVSRLATQKEIRKAYKNLVKEWHPDKTDHPAAESKFVEINRAYELLSDPERRRKFDNHGITEEGLPRYKREDGNYNIHEPFEEFFSGNYKFRYQNRDITLFHKMSITFRAYENNVLPKSHHTPTLILLYSDWCFACLQVEPTWRRLIGELEPLGVNLVTVDAERESALARKLSIHSLPCLAVVIDGRATMFKESIYSVQKVVEFLRSKFPYKLIANVNNNNVDNFLFGWSDNKIRALIFENREKPRLRYLLVALQHRDRVVFGFVQTGIPETSDITDKYKISEHLDTLLLFNENLEKPMASISMQDIPSETMHNVIGNNKFLILPRLSNQATLDSICPQVWLGPQKRLCAILVSQNTPEIDTIRHKFRQAALVSPYSQERVRYAYVYKEMQPQFISALTAGEGSPMDPLHHIVIIWRKDSSRVNYDWFPSGLTEKNIDDSQWNETRSSLEQTIKKLLRSSDALPYATTIQELTDEHALSIVEKIMNKLTMAGDYLTDNLTRETVLPLLSVIATILLVVGMGYGMAYLARLEEANIQSRYGQFKDSVKSVSISPQLKLHEMRAETFNGLVRFLKPGCRTIVLLVDSQSKIKLLPAFHKAVWPYRKNKTLMFCHLSLDRGLEWYKKILQLSLPEPRELNINAKNCVGTVLSLAGHRKYFCMYHAKHPENGKGKNNKRMEKMTKRLARPQDAEAGAFIGFDSSSDSEGSHDESQNDVLYQDKLLDGLPMWLDRLFEGTTQRYFINYWPDFTAK